MLSNLSGATNIYIDTHLKTVRRWQRGLATHQPRWLAGWHDRVKLDIKRRNEQTQISFIQLKIQVFSNSSHNISALTYHRKKPLQQTVKQSLRKSDF
jgi:hypothetical protein